MAILVTGGARSGKSAFAEEYVRRTSKQGVYLAACQPFDEEMQERIAKHREDREAPGVSWVTLEEPYMASELIHRLNEQYAKELESNASFVPPVLLLDCLTLWLSNWLLRIENEELGDQLLVREVDKLVSAIKEYPFPFVIVTNEVGDGIVPAYPLGRRFRDEAGRLNHQVAAICGRVFLVTAGIPLELRQLAFRWEEL